MKSITIIGNLGANAIRRTTSTGREIMTFNVAVSTTKDEAPIWFNCVGTLRENLLPYLLKGQCVCVVGELTARTYKGEIDLSISIDRCELCGKAPQQETQQEQPIQETTKVDGEKAPF